jgi:hypothetical protein
MRRTNAIMAVVLLSPGVSWPCSVNGPMPRPEALVTSARVIVLARATTNAIEGTVEFQVVEALKGTINVPLIRLDGALAGHDDFNDAPPPYGFVRPDGRHGDCRASTYRTGALYLLLLQNADDVVPFYRSSHGLPFTAFWSPLAPTNEQVHGRDDKWVEWVRQRAAGR